jgi:TolA-binding protein
MGNSVAKGAKGRTIARPAASAGRTQVSRKPVNARAAAVKPAAKNSGKPAPKPVAKPASKVSSKVSTKPAVKPAARPAAKTPAKGAPSARREEPARRATAPKAPASRAAAPKTSARAPQAKASKAPAISAKTTTKSSPKQPHKAPRPSPASRLAQRPAPAPAPPKPNVVRPGVVVKAFEAALKFFNRGHFAEARDAFEKLIKHYPDHTDIAARSNTYLAICRARTQAAPKVPQTADTLYDRGVLELNRANYDVAMGFFEKALKVQPGQPHILYSLAAAQVRAGQTDEGLKSLEKAITAKELYRSKARGDFDFSKLTSDPRFRELVGGFWDSDGY